jgi:hypothetical protein
MGRSAKVHKRGVRESVLTHHHDLCSCDQQKDKKSTSTSTSSTSNTPPIAKPPSASEKQSLVAQAKKRTQLKEKAKTKGAAKRTSGLKDGYVLGGADYVEMMSGSRKRAREEAEKLAG